MDKALLSRSPWLCRRKLWWLESTLSRFPCSCDSFRHSATSIIIPQTPRKSESCAKSLFSTAVTLPHSLRVQIRLATADSQQAHLAFLASLFPPYVKSGHGGQHARDLHFSDLGQIMQMHASASHHQCNSCICDCCSLRFHKDKCGDKTAC